MTLKLYMGLTGAKFAASAEQEIRDQMRGRETPPDSFTFEDDQHDPPQASASWHWQLPDCCPLDLILDDGTEDALLDACAQAYESAQHSCYSSARPRQPWRDTHEDIKAHYRGEAKDILDGVTLEGMPVDYLPNVIAGHCVRIVARLIKEGRRRDLRPLATQPA